MEWHLFTVFIIGLLVAVPFLLSRNFMLNRLRPEEDGSGIVHESKKQVHCVGAFLRAVFSGVAATFALHALFATIFGVFSSGGMNNYLNFALIFILPQIALFAWIPIRVISTLLKLLRTPIQWRAILTGTILGALAPIEYLIVGSENSFTARFLGDTGAEVLSMSVILVLSGAIGGFVFWRAYGYPGITQRSGKIIDKLEHRFQIVRSLLTGGVFDKVATVGIPLAKATRNARLGASDREANTPRRTNRPVRAAPAQAGFGKRAR